MGFYEWSAHYVEAESRDGFSVNDVVFIPFVDGSKLKTKKIKITTIKYDRSAPKREWQNPTAICTEKRFFKQKNYEVPLSLLSKTQGEAKDIFIKQRKFLKSIKEI